MIWARWDSSSPDEQAAGYVEHTGRLAGVRSRALTRAARRRWSWTSASCRSRCRCRPARHASQRGREPRLGRPGRPGPVGRGVRSSASVLLEQFAGPLDFMLGFTGKADQVSAPVRLAVPGGGIVIEDASRSLLRWMTRRRPCTARRSGVRLLSGRLGAGPRRRRLGLGRRDARRPASGVPRLLGRQADRTGHPGQRPADSGGQVDEPQPECARDRTEDLGAGLLEPALDLGEVLRRDPGVLRHVGERAARSYGAPREARARPPRATTAPARGCAQEAAGPEMRRRHPCRDSRAGLPLIVGVRAGERPRWLR